MPPKEEIRQAPPRENEIELALSLAQKYELSCGQLTLPESIADAAEFTKAIRVYGYKIPSPEGQADPVILINDWESFSSLHPNAVGKAVSNKIVDNMIDFPDEIAKASEGRVMVFQITNIRGKPGSVPDFARIHTLGDQLKRAPRGGLLVCGPGVSNPIVNIATTFAKVFVEIPMEKTLSMSLEKWFAHIKKVGKKV